MQTKRLPGPEDRAHLQNFDQFGLLMLEQPLWHDDLYFHAQLQKEMKTSFCLDEPIHHARDAEVCDSPGIVPRHQY